MSAEICMQLSTARLMANVKFSKQSQIGPAFFFFFLDILGLCCCAWAFSSCGEQELFSICGAQASLYSGLSCLRAQALGYSGFSSCHVWS